MNSGKIANRGEHAERGAGAMPAILVAADRAVAGTTIVFSDRARTITVGDVSFVLDNRDYALYRTIAQAAKEQWAGVGPGGVGPGHKGWVQMSDFYKSGTHASQVLLENY